MSWRRPAIMRRYEQHHRSVAAAGRSSADLTPRFCRGVTDGVTNAYGLRSTVYSSATEPLRFGCRPSTVDRGLQARPARVQVPSILKSNVRRFLHRALARAAGGQPHVAW